MAVTRICPEDDEETKKAKREEIEEAKQSLKATREMIKREFSEPSPHHRYG